MAEVLRVNFLDLVSKSFYQAHRDIIASRDTDPKSPTYGQKIREFFFRGGRGCVDGDALLDTPEGKVRVRDFKGGLVYAFNGEDVIPAFACGSVKYAEERMYEVSLGDGSSVTVTDQHRFLTRRGWVATKDLSPTDEVFSFLPAGRQSPSLGIRDLATTACASGCTTANDASSVPRVADLPSSVSLTERSLPDPCPTFGDGCPRGLRGDGLRLTRTLVGLLYHYWQDSRLCDGQLPSEAETYRDVFQRLADAPAHTRGNSHMGVPGNGGNDSRSGSDERLRSKQGCHYPLAGKCCEARGIQISRMLSGLLSQTFPSAVRCLEIGDLDGSIQRVAQLLLCSTGSCDHRVGCGVSPRTIQAEADNLQMLSDMLRHRVGDESLSDSLSTNVDVSILSPRIVPRKVIGVRYLKTDNYYDLFVPFYNNYIANGVISHNSTKSSLISLEIVRHLVQFPRSNAIVFVKVAENIRDSVYKQILWAIDHLELNALFKCTTSPFRCVYLPTGQEILFRGLDKAGKIKGIKPTVGYFDQIWFEELTEFNGMEDCRSVIQSALRGGDEDDDQIGDNVPTWEFYSYNPPPTIANWVNVEANKVVPGRKVYSSSYVTVNPRWLGRNFFERAEVLKQSNPRAYAHEYLGWVTGTGGNIFNNLEIRNINDEEIATRFDNRCFGLDWGFANDPFVWLAMNFDRNHKALYIFDEIVALGRRTQETAEMVRKKMARIGGNCTVFADCAEPDSIADFNAWGVKCEGCPKPHGAKWSGRDYEFKALQDLNKIIIDKTYCPKTAEEFQKLEYPKNPHGEFRSEYPHSDPGDACRYGCFWKLREAGLLSV